MWFSWLWVCFLQLAIAVNWYHLYCQWQNIFTPRLLVLQVTIWKVVCCMHSRDCQVCEWVFIKEPTQAEVNCHRTTSMDKNNSSSTTTTWMLFNLGVAKAFIACYIQCLTSAEHGLQCPERSSQGKLDVKISTRYLQSTDENKKRTWSRQRALPMFTNWKCKVG